jgi:hypothetical protein
MTNVALHRSAVRFDSLYEAGPAGLTRKSGFGRIKSLAVGALLAGAWMYQHACRQTSRPVADSGVVICLLN